MAAIVVRSNYYYLTTRYDHLQKPIDYTLHLYMSGLVQQ